MPETWNTDLTVLLSTQDDGGGVSEMIKSNGHKKSHKSWPTGHKYIINIITKQCHSYVMKCISTLLEYSWVIAKHSLCLISTHERILSTKSYKA